VACPHQGCGWTGSLVPSSVQGGGAAEIAPGQRAWFYCPHCQRDWEARISNDRVTVVSGAKHGG
jgi:hypothetical protein